MDAVELRKSTSDNLVTFTMRLPKEVVSYLEKSNAAQTFEQAAMILYPLIKNMDISYFDYTPEELKKEIDGFEEISRKRKVEVEYA